MSIDRLAALLGSRLAAWCLAGVAAALVFLVYRNALHNPFVFDDFHEVVENTSIETLSRPVEIVRRSITRPLVNFSYAIDYRFWGGRDEFGFHVTNLLLHTVNVLLLFALVWQYTRLTVQVDSRQTVAGATLTAFAAAALFAVHPMMTEAVGYISSRSELLVGTFMLSSLYCFHRAFDLHSRTWLTGGFVLFAAALATKETAAVLPMLLLGYDVCLRRDSAGDRRARLWRVHLPLLGLIVTAAVVRVWLFLVVEHPQAQGARWDSVLMSIHVAVRYVRLLVWPAGQSLIPLVVPVQSPYELRFAAAAAALSVAFLSCLFAWRRSPLVAFGILWFFLLLAPSSALTLLSDMGGPMAEHRVYLASCGLFMVAAVAVTAAAGMSAVSAVRPARLASAFTVLVIALVSLSALTIARNRVWNDPVRLWTDTVRKAPGTWAAVEGLADTYRLQGDCASAMPLYREAMELAPHKADTYVAMSQCFFQTARVMDAAAVLRLARSRVPDNADVGLRLAQLEETRFANPGEALRICREVAAAAPQLNAAKECVRRNEERISKKTP